MNGIRWFGRSTIFVAEPLTDLLTCRFLFCGTVFWTGKTELPAPFNSLFAFFLGTRVETSIPWSEREDLLQTPRARTRKLSGTSRSSMTLPQNQRAGILRPRCSGIHQDKSKKTTQQKTCRRNRKSEPCFGFCGLFHSLLLFLSCRVVRISLETRTILPHCPIGFCTGTSVEVPHCVTVNVVGVVDERMYHVPFEGLHTAMSVFASRS